MVASAARVRTLSSTAWSWLPERDFCNYTDYDYDRALFYDPCDTEHKNTVYTAKKYAIFELV